jgi:hypothetical protein
LRKYTRGAIFLSFFFFSFSFHFSQFGEPGAGSENPVIYEPHIAKIDFFFFFFFHRGSWKSALPQEKMRSIAISVFFEFPELHRTQSEYFIFFILPARERKKFIMAHIEFSLHHTRLYIQNFLKFLLTF